MSVMRNAAFIQVGLEQSEATFRRMQEEANRPDAAEAYGVSQEIVDQAKRAIESIGRDIGRLHTLLGAASQESSIPGIAGLGQKGDD